MKAETTKFFVDSMGNYLAVRGDSAKWVNSKFSYLFPYNKCGNVDELIKRNNLRELEMSEIVLIPELDEERGTA